VLLVDDNDAILARASALLAPECDVIGAVHDGRSALEAAASLKPDVIVLDISMPGMTGFQVAARLRQAGSPAAVVFLTVHEDDAFIVAAKEAGAVGYVVKPRLGADLRLAVRAARMGRPFVSVTR
jgi:DNA-binding NarL/FixJ family response regulator